MSSHHTLSDVLIRLTPAEWCQTFFILASAPVLAIAILPASTKSLLLDYGPRNPRAQSDKDGQSTASNEHQTDWVNATVGWLTSCFQIPHSWFSGFYILSVGLSIFWAYQYFSNGSVILAIASHQAAVAAPSMTLTQVRLAWGLMALQGGRRLYEHVRVMRPSKSKMWIVHWLLGMAYYAVISVAVWVEGSHAIISEEAHAAKVEGPSPKVLIGLTGFAYCWLNQWECHAYLAGLKKYSLPDQGLFRHIVCAHYTCEVALYLSLAVVAAPEGQLCNRTLLCAAIFVAINLGATADRTRRWYIGKFGAEQVANKWRMIPFLY